MRLKFSLVLTMDASDALCNCGLLAVLACVDILILL